MVNAAGTVEKSRLLHDLAGTKCEPRQPAHITLAAEISDNLFYFSRLLLSALVRESMLFR